MTSPTGSPGTDVPVLELVDARVRYRDRQEGGYFEAVRGVSLTVGRGEALGLVGESGCGKSSTIRAILGLAPLSEGRLLIDGVAADPRDRAVRSRIGAIFQNPAGSFNPRRSLLDSVAEPLRVWRGGSRSERERAALAELDRVGVTELMARRRPHEVSGGQCQRAAIARATILGPEILICDEPVSALDVSIQAQVLVLLDELRTQAGLAMLFISHDLAVVATLCDRTAVMNAGEIVEVGTTADIADRPQHAYTKLLHDSVPSHLFLTNSGSS
ncbi:ABC transporter ATP-binding protein [Nocardioides sp. L-11A]|uniref:ABC transporter ATP-binding protein n=1 Tax=Nocardioides sp. L-11A TaxID=3043848 RepID=UPI00249CA59F|nr:ABC transporter ATP-binding protein [Nocardioides sp. L-11A]